MLYSKVYFIIIIFDYELLHMRYKEYYLVLKKTLKIKLKRSLILESYKNFFRIKKKMK